ncbi:MAG: hypothetical protein AB7D39_17050 [Pseudodesulfovibrio sp.]|uniref:hypothetical protein n=1 Tax=Pseudodesulfovibrio sp. TaxID=2035812 RepID=UPI003D141494
MERSPSPLAVARRSLGALGERRKRLLVPFLLLAVLSLGQDYFDWWMPGPDPVHWLAFVMPFSVLLMPVEVAFVFVLLTGEGDIRRLPPLFLRKSLSYGLYSVVLIAFVGVFAFILTIACVAALGLFLDGPVAGVGPATQWAIEFVPGLLAACLALRLVLTPAAVVDGRKSPLELSFQLTRKKVFPILLSGVALLGPPGALLLGLEWAARQWFGPMAPIEPLAWAMIRSLLISLFLPLTFSLSTTWYVVLAHEAGPPSPVAAAEA